MMAASIGKDIRGYVPLPPSERTALYKSAAHFLDWAAKTQPHRYFTWSMITRVVMDLSTVPRENSQTVTLIKRAASRIRKHLIQQYNREMENLSGIGVRATTGSLDVLKGRLVERKKTFDRAAAGLAQTAGLVNTAQIPKNAETKPLIQWFDTVVQPNMKRLNEVCKALALPPALEDKKKK